MTGAPHIEIKESPEDLKQLMKKQTNWLRLSLI